MHVQPRKLEKLKKRLQRVLSQENLQAHRNLIQRLSAEMAIEPVDFAAALLLIGQPHLLVNAPKQDEVPALLPIPIIPKTNRTVRYRLDVGADHGVTKEQLMLLLIEESGVDRKRIDHLDLRETFTLVDLPDGMPADIFQLLSEATVGGRRLNIKRVKPNRRRFREIKRANEQL
ncbi:MAG: DbpA RNA binding domain-containing protein [Gammaproteobacteria bacterium]